MKWRYLSCYICKYESLYIVYRSEDLSYNHFYLFKLRVYNEHLPGEILYKHFYTNLCTWLF